MITDLQLLPGGKPKDAPFEPNPFYEKLLKVRESDPKAWAAISPASKLSLFWYDAQRREAMMLAGVSDAEAEQDALCDRLMKDFDDAA